jgi:superfamily II DNA or RNA helicase
LTEGTTPYKAESRDDVTSLRALDIIRPLYILPEDPFVEEVLIPGFRTASTVDCMVGFFSSEILASLAPGLATYIAGSGNKFRLVISPLIRSEDKAALEEGVKPLEAIAREIMEELIITEDLLQQHTLRCFTWLLQSNRIEIRIALMKDALFHPKVWLFTVDSDVMVAHGSSNITYAGVNMNIEQVAISRSWEDPNQSYIADKLCRQFSRLWENKEDSCHVVEMPQAVRDQLLQIYHSDCAPKESELYALYGRAAGVAEGPPEPYEVATIPDPSFAIPAGLRFEDGPFKHQGDAVQAWCDADYRGVLEMATGSGKTITSMICAHRLYVAEKPLLIVVAAPYVPLIEQWCEEIVPFGLKPENLTIAGGSAKRAKILQKLKRRLQTGLSDIEAIVVSHDTLCTPKFLSAIEGFGCARLIIADEVHNLGRQSFINDLPDFFEYRLGLSATPIRQYDEEGTEALSGFFGPVVFQFPLEEAIGLCLVEYDYYVHPVYLTETEMDDWLDLTRRIKQNSWRDADGKPDDYLAKLLRDRRALLETASGKIATLRMLLENETGSLRHTLIYTSDKGPEQIESVNRLLRDRNILYHQLTAEETTNRERTKQIIRSFQNGEIQILTAKRVLDEGVNIPQICRAFILASTTVERQWVQRRGRLLRKCSDISKTHSVIHDLLALPRGMDEGLDPDARALVRSELRRAQEFASLARNAGRPDGPLSIIDRMVDAAYL